MKVGIIGAGDIGQRLTMHMLKAGHEVVICNSKKPETLAQMVSSFGKGVYAGTLQEVSEQEVVILAVWWDVIPKVMEQIPDWRGRILIDVTNQLTMTEQGPSRQLQNP